MKTHLLWLPLLVSGVGYLGSDQPNLFKYHDKHPKSGRYFRLEHRF